MEVFAGRMYKVGIIRYVDVPKEVSRGDRGERGHMSRCAGRWTEWGW